MILVKNILRLHYYLNINYLNKRLGQISEGKEAWLKHCQRYGDGSIHGSVITNACVSGRCSHRNPNIAKFLELVNLMVQNVELYFMLLTDGDRWDVMHLD